MQKKYNKIESLLEIMGELREKCPWDREQTMLSLRTNTIEETFELTDAIINEDMDGIKEELGDLLLHIVFYSQIAQESKAFNFGDVVNTVCEKLIYRHPHIYSTTQAESSKEVKANWEALKQAKKSALNQGALSGVPRSMPALPKAFRIGEKAAATGFDWDKREDVWDKVREEAEELAHELKDDTIYSRERVEEEFGDLYFALTNAARLYKIDPEVALERTNRKFISRFEYMEQKAREKGVNLHTQTLAQMDEWWSEAKKTLGNKNR